MKTIHINDDLVFGEKGPYGQQLVSDQIGKIVRYTLKKDQELDEMNAPFQPRYYVVLHGEGLFKSEDGEEQRCGPGSLVVFAPKEENSILAISDELVVIGFLHWPTGG